MEHGVRDNEHLNQWQESVGCSLLAAYNTHSAASLRHGNCCGNLRSAGFFASDCCIAYTPFIHYYTSSQLLHPFTTTHVITELTSYRAVKRYASADGSSRREHIDGEATWRMLLKRHRRRLRCRFGHLRWPYGRANEEVRLPVWGFLLVFYSNRSPKTHVLR